MKKYDADLSNASEEDRKIFDEADGKAEYDKCVEISTQASIREMVLPGLLAVFIPILIGFGGEKKCLEVSLLVLLHGCFNGNISI